MLLINKISRVQIYYNIKQMQRPQPTAHYEYVELWVLILRHYYPSLIYYCKTQKKETVFYFKHYRPLNSSTGAWFITGRGNGFTPLNRLHTQACVCVWMCPMRRCLLCLTSALSRARSTLNLNERLYYVELSRTDPKHLAEASRPRSSISLHFSFFNALFTWSQPQSMRLPLKLPFPVIGPAGMSLSPGNAPICESTRKDEQNTQWLTFATDRFTGSTLHNIAR